MQEFLQIGIVGTAISLIVQAIKNKFGIEGIKTQLIVIGLSLLVGTVYVLFSDAVWWKTVLSVLSSSTLVWAFVLKGRMENN